MEINEAHHKYGHLSEVVLRRTMSYHGITVHGEMKVCAACALYKARARVTSKVTGTPANRPGERIFMDTSGPFPATLDGSVYWVKFKDQYSGMSWNAFVKARVRFLMNLILD